ncbi:MAG: hypothetical protein EXR71_03935 [Myxococcales bacterium]|nr:hypothetical protein [Myxococcales bacterium]
MSAKPWDLLVLVVVLVANRTLVKWFPHPLVFWSFQGVLVATAVWFGLYGIDGLDRVPVARVVVTGLLVFHLIQNVVIRRGGKKL